jgi:hypothetical protein
LRPWNKFDTLVPAQGLFDSFMLLKRLAIWLPSTMLPLRLSDLGDLAISKDSFKADLLLLFTTDDDSFRLVM